MINAKTILKCPIKWMAPRVLSYLEHGVMPGQGSQSESENGIMLWSLGEKKKFFIFFEKMLKCNDMSLKKEKSQKTRNRHQKCNIHSDNFGNWKKKNKNLNTSTNLRNNASQNTPKTLKSYLLQVSSVGGLAVLWFPPELLSLNQDVAACIMRMIAWRKNLLWKPASNSTCLSPLKRRIGKYSLQLHQ